MGESKALFSFSLATMVITAVGVFIPVAVLMVAPIALSVGNKMGISKLALLLSLSGGGKAGNVISPNPNTIVTASAFHLKLSDVMVAGMVPALFRLIVTVIIATLLKKKGNLVLESEASDAVDYQAGKSYPSLSKAIVAPAIAVILLMINPLGSILNIQFLSTIKLDALYVLPFAGIIGLIAMGKKMKLFVIQGLD